MEKILPVGSVVYLQEGTAPLVIVAIAQFAKKAESERHDRYLKAVEEWKANNANSFELVTVN